MQITRKNAYRIAAVAAALLLVLILQIDDWGRDLTGHAATISTEDAERSEDAVLQRLQPHLRSRSLDVLAEGVLMAASRIRNWQLVGDTSDGETTAIVFVRIHRLLRIKDDIVVRIEDRGDRRVLAAESQSRLHIGDLGRNPRNLRRLLSELEAVLAESAAFPVLQSPVAERQ